jgi:hypothetical protein
LTATHSDIEAVNGFVDRDGILWAVPVNGDPAFIVQTPKGLNEDFRHVIQASLMMYKTLAATKIGYDKIVAYAEACGDQQLVGHILQLQAAVIVTMRCAIEGLDTIAKNSQKRD